MTRIMHVITGLDTGGAEMMLWKLLAASKDDWNSVVVSLAQEGPMKATIGGLGIPVHCLGGRRSMPNPLCLVPCIGLVRRFRPQIIQGWMPHGNLAASCAQLACGISTPVMWNIRMSLEGMDDERPITRRLIRLGAVLSWHPKAIVYNSRAGAEQHEKIGYRAARRVVIPNGFDCQIFRPDDEAREQVRATLRLGRETVLIGLVARYHPMKDHAGIHRAASLVTVRCPSARFLLVGKGLTANQPALPKLIAELNLTDRVLLLGERRDTPRITAALDIACSSSSWGEGFSNAIGEAMACGVPCVVTEVGDNAYLVGGTGLVVPLRNPEALARAICELIDCGPPKRRELGMAARRRIKTEFSLQEIARRYQGLYQSCSESAKKFGVSNAPENLQDGHSDLHAEQTQ